MFFVSSSAAWFLCPLLDSFIHGRDSPLKKNFFVDGSSDHG